MPRRLAGLARWPARFSPIYKTLYDVLGVDPFATEREIQKAYRLMARRFHPDANPGASKEELEKQKTRMLEVNAAWEVLSDPARREQYNLDAGLQAIIDSAERWAEPPLPRGFDYWPRRGLFGPRAFSVYWSRIGDATWRALSIVPLGNDLSPLRDLWPGGVWKLVAGGQRITDDQLAHVAGLESLRYLDLSQSMVGDAGLAHLANLPHLNHLDLAGTLVSDAGLEQVEKIDSLEFLNLHDTEITDDGLKHLSGLVILDHLDIRGTKVTGPGLRHLFNLQDLDVLLIPRKIGRAYHRQIRDAIPGVKLA